MDYAPIIPPVTWSNSWSVAFVDLISVLAAAQVVSAAAGGVGFAIGPDGGLGTRAKQLLTRELVARLATGSAYYSTDYDPLLDPSYFPVGQLVADEFARRATSVPYTPIDGGSVHFSVPVPRRTGLDVTDLFVQVDAVAAYAVELSAVLALMPQLRADLAAQAIKNTALDPTTAATAATALATARSAYVSSLSSQFPTRGYA